MKLDIGRRLGLFGVGLVAAAVAILPGTGAAEGRPLTRWLGSWATSPSPPDLAGPSVAGFANQTLREVVYLHFGGGRVRVRVTNAFGVRILIRRSGAQADEEITEDDFRKRFTFVADR